MAKEYIQGKLSVIVPIYNVKKYLRECIDSILEQDFCPFELVLVDDGSTDGSGKICEEYGREDKRVKIIHQNNQGHTFARLNGLNMSEGEYILFIDSDDWIEQGMFSTMMEKAISEDADIVQCNYCAVKGERKKEEIQVYEEGLYNKELLKEKIYPSMIYAGGDYKFGIAPNIWNKIFRRDLLEKYLPLIDKGVLIGEDGILTYACFLEARRVYLLSKAFYNYRSRDNSICHAISGIKLNQNHLLFQCYQDWFGKEIVLQKQIERYIVYQTLLAVEELIQMTSLRKIKKAYPYFQGDSLERQSIRNTKISTIQGKKRKLILLGLKI